jgi:hypothetical protein
MFVAVFLGFYQGWSKLNFILLGCFLFTGRLRLLIPLFGNQAVKRVRAMDPDERAEFLNRLTDQEREAMEKQLQKLDV